MEGKPGAGQVPGGILPGQAGDPGGLGGGQQDRRDRDGAGQPADGGHDGGARVYLQVSIGDAVVSWVRDRSGFRRRGGTVVSVSAGEGVAEGDDAELGGGGQQGVPVQGVPGAGLGLVPAERVFPGPERGFDRYVGYPACLIGLLLCDQPQVSRTSLRCRSLLVRTFRTPARFRPTCSGRFVS